MRDFSNSQIHRRTRQLKEIFGRTSRLKCHVLFGPTVEVGDDLKDWADDLKDGILPILEPTLLYSYWLNGVQSCCHVDFKNSLATFCCFLHGDKPSSLGRFRMTVEDEVYKPGELAELSPQAVSRARGILCAEYGNCKPGEDEFQILSTIQRIWAGLRESVRLSLCKNVSLSERTYGIARNAELTKRGKRKKFLDSYYILDIPGANVSKTGGLRGPVDLRHHVVRGHFKRFTEQSPRFGRLSDGVGEFWIPCHARGNPELGAITKDYRVKGIQEDENSDE